MFSFTDLLHLRIESRDKILNDYLKSEAKNFLYISHEIQTCANVLRQKIIEEIKRLSVFSVLTDEIADISDIKQLSIGVRYLP